MQLGVIGRIRNLWTAQSGQDMMEYALVGGFAAAAIMAVCPVLLTSNALFDLVISTIQLAAK